MGLNNEGNVESSKIKIFPAVKRYDDYLEDSKLFSEANLVKLVNKLLDCDSFVISREVVSTNTNIVFNIQGYYVDATIPTNAIGSGKFFATILVGADGDFTELKGQDTQGTAGYYDGVFFTQNTDKYGHSDIRNTYTQVISGITYNVYSLELLYNNEIPQESTIKYDGKKLLENTIISGIVDGGTIT